MKKFCILALLALLGLAGLLFSYSKKSSCFCPDFALAPKTLLGPATPLPSQEIQEILSQPFFFLGSGNQSFAFESEDKQYVLKLFKFHCLYGFDPYGFIPSRQKEREHKADRLMTGLLTAYSLNRDHSGLLYLHFPSKEKFAHDLHIRDKAFRLHKLDPSQYVFVLQKKASVLNEVLKKSLQQGDIQAAVNHLQTLLNMIATDLKQGIYDQDHNVMVNTGFVSRMPMRIDFGKLCLKEEMKHPEAIQKELSKITHERILPWVKRHFPDYEPEIRFQLIF